MTPLSNAKTQKGLKSGGKSQAAADVVGASNIKSKGYSANKGHAFEGKDKTKRGRRGGGGKSDAAAAVAGVSSKNKSYSAEHTFMSAAEAAAEAEAGAKRRQKRGGGRG